MATMLDVSIRAGVSKATVSRVLNGTGQVKESTRQQVFKAMEELGYRPNFLARSLANQTSNSIGLVVSTFDGFYFGRLLQQASRQTEAWGKQLIVTDGHDTPALETADAALTHNRLTGLAQMISLARATHANIRQNIAIALGLKGIFLVTTLLGLTGLWLAVLADTGATVLVTANALRLLRKKL